MTFVEGFMVASVLFTVITWAMKSRDERCRHTTDEFDHRMTAQQIQTQILAQFVGCSLPTVDELRQKVISMRYACGSCPSEQREEPDRSGQAL